MTAAQHLARKVICLKKSLELPNEFNRRASDDRSGNPEINRNSQGLEVSGERHKVR